VNPTTYRVVRHARSREVWVLRIEAQTLTGAFGPVPERQIPPQLADLSYADHPDDLEWIVRAWEHLEAIGPDRSR
jgi:hypothetical protein